MPRTRGRERLEKQAIDAHAPQLYSLNFDRGDEYTVS